MTTILKYIVYNTLFALSVYYGLYVGHAGALNIMKFMIWLSFIVAALVYFASLANEKVLAGVKKPVIPPIVNQIYQIAITIALVYVGWFGYATLYVIHSLLIAALVTGSNEYRNKIENNDEHD